MIADKFRDRRVFLCGDAANIWVPFAGYGMNAGIADAINLSWKLAGVINGSAAEPILDAYEWERLPVTGQVSRYAMQTSFALQSFGKAFPEGLEEIGEAGDAVRARVGREAYDLNFGYFYEGSPIILYDGDVAPMYTMYEFKQSTVPGCRTPHLWLHNGRSLYDALGPESTLLRFNPKVDLSEPMAAAAQSSFPLVVLDVDADSNAGSPYKEQLVLSRPDQHVAWRGNELPQDLQRFVDHLRGLGSRASGDSAGSLGRSSGPVVSA